jgi:hypothetical protein
MGDGTRAWVGEPARLFTRGGRASHGAQTMGAQVWQVRVVMGESRRG